MSSSPAIAVATLNYGVTLLTEAPSKARQRLNKVVLPVAIGPEIIFRPGSKLTVLSVPTMRIELIRTLIAVLPSLPVSLPGSADK